MEDNIEVKVQTTPREELIKTAVSFLMNPNVQKSPASQKEAFLKKKGLTTDEIRIAFEKSSNHLIIMPEVHQIHPKAMPLAPTSWFHRIKDSLHAIVLIIGAFNGLYFLYKKFIEPFFFRKGKKAKPGEGDPEKQMEKAISELKSDMQKVQHQLDRVILESEQNSSTKLMGELKSEIATVKGILLSRHQFSSVNFSGPSIPAWQLSESLRKEDKENEDGDRNSGSSETEIVPNPNSNGSQGSDSSLEMIKEVDNL